MPPNTTTVVIISSGILAQSTVQQRTMAPTCPSREDTADRSRRGHTCGYLYPTPALAHPRLRPDSGSRLPRGLDTLSGNFSVRALGGPASRVFRYPFEVVRGQEIATLL